MSTPPIDHTKNSPLSFFSAKTFSISFVLSVGSLIAVAWYSYEPGMFDKLHVKRLFGLGIALIVSVLRVFFFGWKLRVLSDYELGWMAAMRASLTWDFASFVTPSTIGGGPVAAYAMSREGVSLGKSTAILLYGLLLDQLWFAMAIPMMLVAGIFYEVIPSEAGNIGKYSLIGVYATLMIYAAILAYAVLVNPHFLKKVVSAIFKLPILNRFAEKIESEMGNLEGYAEELRGRKFRFIFKAFVLSTMAWLSRITLVAIVVLSFMPADVMLTLWRSLAMNVAFLVLPTPGGSGGVEGLFLVFQGPIFHAMNRGYFIGLALFLWRFIGYFLSFGVGVFVMSGYLKKPVTSKIK